MIDKNPAIGRIIILKRDPKVYRGHFAGYGGIITREPKTQIYFKDKNGRETFARNFVAICDTEEEAQSILKLSQEASNAFEAWEDKYKVKLSKLVNERVD